MQGAEQRARTGPGGSKRPSWLQLRAGRPDCPSVGRDPQAEGAGGWQPRGLGGPQCGHGAPWDPLPGTLLRSSAVRSMRTGSPLGQSCFPHEALGAALGERLGAALAQPGAPSPKPAPGELCDFSREAEPESSLCSPPEDACGDGELDLSGIDDLEIDRVGAACARGLPGRGPGCAPWGVPGLRWWWALSRLPGSASLRAVGSPSPDLSAAASGLWPLPVLQLLLWPSARLLLWDPGACTPAGLAPVAWGLRAAWECSPGAGPGRVGDGEP